MNGIEKRSIWHLEFWKTDPFWPFGEGCKLGKNSNFRNAGQLVTEIAGRLWLIWPRFKHHYLRLGPRVAEKKKLAQNDPVAPSYGRWRETNFGKKKCIFSIVDLTEFGAARIQR